MVDDQDFLDHLLFLFGFEVFFNFHEVPFNSIDLLLYIINICLEPFKETEEIMRLKNAVAVLVEESKDPEVDELHATVDCTFNQITVTSEAKCLRKAKEVEEPLNYFDINHVAVLAEDRLSCHLYVIDQNIILGAHSSPFPELLSSYFLVYI